MGDQLSKRTGTTQSKGGRTNLRPEAGVINARAYSGGKPVADISIDEAGSWASRPGHVVWIGLFEPSQDLLHRVRAQFNLHPLIAAGPDKGHQRPKLEQHGDSLFIVTRTAQMIENRIAFGETHLWVGRGYVVTIRHGASITYATVRERCESTPSMLSFGEDYILFALLDFIVDNYLLVIDSVTNEVEVIEDHVLDATLTQAEVQRLYMMRRDLLRLRNAAASLVDVCRKLKHADVMEIAPQVDLLLRDVTDHVHSVRDQIDALREVLAFTFEASMMSGQMEQTYVTRRLASWAGILGVPTAIAGIYGMNFDNMPELKWTYGYFVVITVIVSVCGFLYMRFRKAGWL